jgi:anti-sigma factor RsiW
MSCDDFIERASDYADGRLDAADRAAADRHLASCEVCRALLADLRRVQQSASGLERVALPADAWARIDARLHADPAFAQAAAASGAARRPALTWHSWAWLATAAALVLVVGASLFYISRQPAAGTGAGRAASSPANASAEDLVQSIESELALAATHYERAIASLERVAEASDSPLDPEVTATLRKNIDLIDQAIDDSRAALKAEPESRIAQESLFDAFRKKVTLLQDTIALMNELRKGNADGASRVVEGLNKS